MAINTATNFNVGANLPIDDRQVVSTYNDLESLLKYEGLVTYVEDEKCQYIYKDSKWEKIEQNIDLTDYALKSEVPTKVSQLENDKNYLESYTETDPTVPTHVKNITSDDITNWNSKSNFSGNYNDLSNKPDLYSKEDINNLVSSVPKFNVEVVDSLPTSNISSTTVYLISGDEEEENIYTEYIYVNENWEKLGTQKNEIDLDNYLPLAGGGTITGSGDPILDIASDGITSKAPGLGNSAKYYYDGVEIIQANSNPYSLYFPEKSGTIALTSDLNDYIKQNSSITLSKPLTVTGGNSASAGKIIIDESNKGQITNKGTGTLFGFNNTSDLTVGAPYYNLLLRGAGTRPKYNGNDLALKSDIPTSSGSSRKWHFITRADMHQTITLTANISDYDEIMIGMWDMMQADQPEARFRLDTEKYKDIVVFDFTHNTNYQPLIVKLEKTDETGNTATTWTLTSYGAGNVNYTQVVGDSITLTCLTSSQSEEYSVSVEGR